jgi:integrase
MRQSVNHIVTLQPHPGRDNLLRIRWSFNGKRYSLYVPGDQSRLAEQTQKSIQTDLERNTFDCSLKRYKALTIADTVNREFQEERSSILKFFDEYLTAIGRDTATPNYYFHVRQMLVRWGAVSMEQVPGHLLKMNYSPVTFNSRKGLLSTFFEWLIKKKQLEHNPLDDLKAMRQSRQTNSKRKPFTKNEVSRILQALKNDTYSQSKSYPHSQYHDIVYFMLSTGVRNGEAIGLTVGDIDFDAGEIRIWRSLSRTRKGSNVAARVLKSTKMENERFLPLKGAKALRLLLTRLCAGKKADDFVFQNKRGNPIDDKMLQRRCIKPLLEKLQIRDRDLYACRHTFATRAISEGMQPHTVAYLMGDTVDTVLRNYFHNNQKPAQLPKTLV